MCRTSLDVGVSVTTTVQRGLQLLETRLRALSYGTDAYAFADCIEIRARCRACETLNGVHGSSVSCDFFDDGESLNQIRQFAHITGP